MTLILFQIYSPIFWWVKAYDCIRIPHLKCCSKKYYFDTISIGLIQFNGDCVNTGYDMERRELRSVVLRFLSMAFVYLIVLPAMAQSKVVRVIDGDTIEIASTIYRLHGIDAPEAGQKCKNPNGKTWNCGNMAIAELEQLVSMGSVSCDDRGQDDYDRVIAVCKVGRTDINAAMVDSGFAWAFRKYSEDYIRLEDNARAAARGVWVAESQTPWDFRAERWAVAEQESPLGCPIKGNISKSGRIYHAPWSPWYTRTRVSIDKGERWFCSEAEALDEGWRAPYWGR